MFPLRMALREVHVGWAHTNYFILCIALGVGSIVGIEALSQNLKSSVDQNARSLMASDVEISTRLDLNPQDKKFLLSLTKDNIRWIHINEMLSMASSSDQQASQLVELKAIDNGYPFYGTFKSTPKESLNNLLGPQPSTFDKYGVLVQKDLLFKLNLKVGNQLLLGHALFIITGTIEHEPDRIANAFSLGPRVLISKDGLTASQLLKPASRVHHRYLFKVPASIPPGALKEILEKELSQNGLKIKTFHEVRPRVQEFLKNLTFYLGFIGLMTLLIAGIGVVESMRSLIRKYLKSIAILKCLGASSKQIMAIYLFQALIIGMIGSLIGIVLGTIIQFTLPLLLNTLFAFNVSHQLSYISIVKGLLIGVTTAVVCTSWPLLEIKHIGPYSIFRRYTEAATGPLYSSLRFRLNQSLLPATLIFLAMFGVIYSHTQSIPLGIIFIGFLLTSIIILICTTYCVIYITKRTPKMCSLIWHHGLNNLSRPGNHTMPTIIAIGLSVMLIMSILLIKNNLLTHIGTHRPDTTPSFFFIDIQPDQKSLFIKTTKSFIDKFPDLSTKDIKSVSTIYPLIRSRLTHINETPIEIEKIKHEENSWYFSREYVLTFSDTLPEHNTILRGKWWSKNYSGNENLVSIEEDVAQHLGVDLGSTISLDVQGIPIRGTVTSIRRVNWNSLTTNFYIIFSPGALKKTPMTYAATIQIPPEVETTLQRHLITAIPNITAIRVREVLELVTHVIEHISLSIHFMGLFGIVASMIVLASALAATRHQRLYDASIFKTLGATRVMISKTLAVEYTVTGASAGIIGIILAVFLSWAILTFIMKIPWIFYPSTLFYGLITTIVLTATIGFFSTFHILNQKPLKILRED